MTSHPYNLISALALALASCNANPHEDRAAHATPDVTQAQRPAPAPEPAPVLAPPTPAPQEFAGPVVTPIFTVGEAPPRGTPTEYDQMVEALRAPMVAMHGPMDMSADSIRRLGDWAWLTGMPHDPGSRVELVNAVGALMHKVSGTWKLVTIACGEDSDACAASWKRFPIDHPDAPEEIFPNAKPASRGAPAMLTGQFGGTHFTLPLADLAKAQLAPGETFKITELARDESASHHIVALLDREPLHRHNTHDLMVVVLEGEGTMLIGTHTQPIGPHSIVYVPRRAAHSMHNTKSKPLIGYAVFTPAFDGKDRVPVAQP